MSEQQQVDLSQLSLADFIEEAAAKKSTPGGGAIAAVTGALGASMMAMSVNFTRGPEKFKDVAEEMDAAAEELARARSMFLELMAEDTKAFAAWQEAWRMDKEDPGRAEALKLATATAISVPQEIATLSLAILQKTAKLANKVNQRLLSDVGVSAVLADAAMRAAHYNIRVNLASLDDENQAAELRSEMADQVERARNLLSQVEAKMAGQF